MSDLDQPIATDDEPGPAAQSETGTSGRARGRLGRLSRLAPWVLLALALAVAVVSTLQWWQLERLESQRAEVERTAATFMLTLTTWDAAEGMAGTREELREAGTERFAGEVDELFGTTEDLRGLEEIAARSQGEVRRAFVQELDDDRAVALVVVSQRLTADVVEGEEVSVRYAELDLLRSPAGWLVDDVELLVDVATQDAEPVAPPGTDLEEEGS